MHVSAVVDASGYSRQLYQLKMASENIFFFYEKLAKFVRLHPCVYNKSSGDFKDVNRKKLCWKMLQRQLVLKVVSGHFYSFVVDHWS